MKIDWVAIICFMPVFWYALYKIGHHTCSNRITDWTAGLFQVSTIVLIVAIIGDCLEWQPFLSY